MKSEYFLLYILYTIQLLMHVHVFHVYEYCKVNHMALGVNRMSIIMYKYVHPDGQICWLQIFSNLVWNKTNSFLIVNMVINKGCSTLKKESYSIRIAPMTQLISHDFQIWSMLIVQIYIILYKWYCTNDIVYIWKFIWKCLIKR